MAVKADQKLRKSRLMWVPLGMTRVADEAQGQFRKAHADALAANFEIEAMGFPVVSHRPDGLFYIVDGQHRIAAAKTFGFCPEDKFQMETYEGLSVAEEAELFLERNTIKPKSAWDKFKVGIAAGREVEVDIDRVVRAQGLVLASYKGTGTIAAVSTVRHIYGRHGAVGLGRTLRIIRDSYGDAGLDAPVLDGVSLFLHRYGAAVDDNALVSKLSNTAGGLNGLLMPAAKLKATMGQPISQCIAASAVALYNRGHGGKKLAPWWKE